MLHDRDRLTPYWIEVPGDPLGRFGVSAYSLEDAFGLLREVGYDVDPGAATVRAGVRVSDLDPLHVVPNVGVVVRRGVWYPNVAGPGGA